MSARTMPRPRPALFTERAVDAAHEAGIRHALREARKMCERIADATERHNEQEARVVRGVGVKLDSLAHKLAPEECSCGRAGQGDVEGMPGGKQLHHGPAACVARGVPHGA